MKATVQQPAAPQPVMSTGSMLTHVSSVLAVIVLLILLCGWVAKRTGFASRRSGSKTLTVSASCQLGSRERVVIVDTEDARLVLGVTQHQITHLHTLAKASGQLTESTETPVPANFRQMIQSFIKPGAQK